MDATHERHATAAFPEDLVPDGLHVADYDFHLPEDRIARHPLRDPGQARLLVLERGTGAVRHHRMQDLPWLLEGRTQVVVNDSAVAPSALELDGQRVSFGQDPETLRWEVLGPSADVVHPLREADATGLAVPDDAAAALLRGGQVTWPRYLAQHADPAGSRVPGWYDTAYARHPGSVAPPSGGLNLTPEILGGLEARGHGVSSLTHHVGAVTFRRPRTVDLRDHEMEGERYFLRGPQAQAIRDAQARGDRILAVGTTTTRTLEHLALQGGLCGGWQTGVADLFITPQHRFQAVDALLTGLHGPGTTLLVLVCAFGGRTAVLDAYREAVARGYRWFTLGDSMLIL